MSIIFGDDFKIFVVNSMRKINKSVDTLNSWGNEKIFFYYTYTRVREYNTEKMRDLFEKNMKKKK